MDKAVFLCFMVFLFNWSRADVFRKYCHKSLLLFMKHKNDMKFTYFVVLPRWKKHHPKKVAPRVGCQGSDDCLRHRGLSQTRLSSRSIARRGRRGSRTPKAHTPTYYFGHFFQRLHDNENSELRVGCPWRPLDPPTAMSLFFYFYIPNEI